MFEPLGEKKLMVGIQQLQLSNWNNDQLIENRTGEAIIDSKQQKLCNEGKNYEILSPSVVLHRQ